ncbi:MAG: RNA methyltransferase [Chitinophagaceae bacterium]
MILKSQVKYIQSLNEKKFRNEEGVFVAEGPKIVRELMAASNMQVVTLFATTPWLSSLTNLQELSAELHELSEDELQRISFMATPNQVLGVFKQPAFAVDSLFADNLSLLLDGIQDPGNMGTIIRIADWFGIRQVIASRNSVDVFNPKVIQSTMGSIARVQITYHDIDEFIGQHAGIPLYASSLNGKPLASFGKVKEGMLLIGNESKGVRDELIERAQHQVTIPRFGDAESLNAAVATGIILSHLR